MIDDTVISPTTKKDIDERNGRMYSKDKPTQTLEELLKDSFALFEKRIGKKPEYGVVSVKDRTEPFEFDGVMMFPKKIMVGSCWLTLAQGIEKQPITESK